MSSDCKVPNVYGGTHPYGPGGIGVGGIFRSLFRTTTPFLKKTARIVGTRMINTGLEKEMQILQDDMKSEPLKKGAKSRTKAAGKSLLEGTINNITQQGRGGRVHKRVAKAQPVSTHQNKKRRSSRSTFKTLFD